LVIIGSPDIAGGEKETLTVECTTTNGGRILIFPAFSCCFERKVRNELLHVMMMFGQFIVIRCSLVDFARGSSA